MNYSLSFTRNNTPSNHTGF